MLRTLLFALAFLPMTVVVSSACVLAKLLDRSGRLSNRVGVLWSRATVALAGLRVQADLDALPPGGHCVYMANHQSQFDIPLLNAMLPGAPLCFVAKESLFNIPFLGWAMKAAGHIAIDRGNRRSAMRSIDQAVAWARNGASIIIFPEGTRNKNLDKLDEFKVGGMILALKTGLPVAPVVLSGTGHILPKHSLRIGPGRKSIRLRALEPIDPARFTLKQREQLKDELHQRMNDAYLELRQWPNNPS